jgi:hypothetical protein
MVICVTTNKKAISHNPNSEQDILKVLSEKLMFLVTGAPISDSCFGISADLLIYQGVILADLLVVTLEILF